MYRIVITLFATVFFFHSAAAGQSLNEQIEKLIKQQLPNATVAVVVKDIATNRVLYQRNADKLLSPASGIKVYTAIAALYGLGPNYRFVTQLFHKANQYYLRFGGSPSFKKEELTSLLSNLKQSMVNHQTKVVIDSSRFKSPDYPDGTSYDDMGWYYAAPDTAAIINENAVAYQFLPSQRANLPVAVATNQANTGITIINHLKTASKQDKNNHCQFNIEVKPNNTMRLYGCMLKSKNPVTMKLAVPNPLLRAKQEIKSRLTEQGIKLATPINNGITPNDAEEIARIESVSLFKLVKRMLKKSNNIYANSITKELGYSQTGEGSYKHGTFAIKKLISQNTKINMKGVRLYDGEGTRYNLITANHMVSLLAAIYKDKPMREFLLKALPQSSRSGSLEGRMHGTALEGKVFAKTGSMHDIASLSGYVIDGAHSPLVFSIIINGLDKPLRNARAVEEKILLMVYQSDVARRRG